MSDTKKPEEPKKEGEQPAKELPPIVIKIKKILATIVQIIQKIRSSKYFQLLMKLVNSISAFIKKLGWLGWLKIFTSLLLVVLGAFSYKFIPHLKNIWEFPYLASFEKVASDSFEVYQDEKIIKYSNELLAPQHIVQLNKIVVNITPSPRSTKNPMIAFDLYIRADSEEAAIEIKNREKQFQDHLQRFTESLSYDQISSEDGKVSWKLKMRKELNAIINNGRVRDIYFKNLIIKP